MLSISTRSIASALLLLSAGSVLAAPALVERDGHTDVKPLPEFVPDTPIGRALIAFKPELKIQSGCHPFAAVDATGKINGGLKTTGASDGSCGLDLSSGGQVYARVKQVEDRWALMYAFYFPKDQPSPGLGHRHDWEGVVVWLDDPNLPEPKVLGVAASGHGDWDYRDVKDAPLDGIRAKIEYKNTWPNTHRMGFTNDIGENFPLLEWDSMPELARNALNTASYEKAVVPLKDATFDENLAKARN